MALFEWQKVAKTLHAMVRQRSGNVVIIMALAAPVLLGITGAAVDYTSASKSRSRLQMIADSAALAVAKEMTLSKIDDARAQSIAVAVANANAVADDPVTIAANMIESGFAVQVRASSTLKTPFGMLSAYSGVSVLDAFAIARVNPSSVQTKLCLLSLGERGSSGILMYNGAVISAPECTIQSNSPTKESVTIQAGSKLKASLLCARGGINNMAGLLESTMVTDCPAQSDPLATKVEPAIDSACKAKTVIVFMGTKTLDPGTYCKGVFIFGNAKVTFKPGVYVFKDGPLVVAGNAEIYGNGVSFLMTGKYSMIRFHENALVQISAPPSGPTAGMLIWELKGWIQGKNSWANGGCGSEPSGKKKGFSGNTAEADDEDDDGPTGCTTVRAYVMKLLKKTNEHQINADRARQLTGTIYMPRGALLIDSTRPIADLSPFTVLVVNRLDLYDGPSLVLNTNYNGSNVPVPAGLGPLGAGQVRLGK